MPVFSVPYKRFPGDKLQPAPINKMEGPPPQPEPQPTPAPEPEPEPPEELEPTPDLKARYSLAGKRKGVNKKVRASEET